jgi:hypothetical protein
MSSKIIYTVLYCKILSGKMVELSGLPIKSKNCINNCVLIIAYTAALSVFHVLESGKEKHECMMVKARKRNGLQSS